MINTVKPPWSAPRIRAGRRHPDRSRGAETGGMELDVIMVEHEPDTPTDRYPDRPSASAVRPGR